MVITGDNKKTAEAICQAIGVFRPRESLKDKSFTGARGQLRALQRCGGLRCVTSRLRAPPVLPCPPAVYTTMLLHVVLLLVLLRCSVDCQHRI